MCAPPHGSDVANSSRVKRTTLCLLITAAAACGEGSEHLDVDAGEGSHGPDATSAGADAGSDARHDDAGGPDAMPADYPYSDLDVGCAPVFAQNIVPEYWITIAPDHWAALQHEFHNPVLSETGQIVDPPYHPVGLHVVAGGAEHDPQDVMIRLNGNTSWLQALLYDADPKMQLVVAFNKINPDGRFQAQRKIKLDMPRNDFTFLQQRVALAWLRGRSGTPAQCANTARLYINGQYYGVYSNVEAQDKGFLKRVYGGDHNDGDLWKGARVITTNEEMFDWTRITAFWQIFDLAGLDTLTDLDVSMREWASEAVIGDADGYNNGRANFLLYDHPTAGEFVWLVNDLDTALDEDFLAPTSTPVLMPMPSYMPRWERDWHHYLLALNDPAGVARYVVAMAEQLPKLDPEEVARWIADWSAQIEPAVAEEPHRTFAMDVHALALERMTAYAPARAAYLQTWLACWEAGGADADGDTYDLCHDCNDADPAQHPGATETCDAVDNDCDGRVDDLDPACSSQPTSRRADAWRKALLHVKPVPRR